MDGEQPQFGSRAMAYMGAFRRPSVQTVEKFDTETQGKIPLIKCIGAGFGVFAFLTSAAFIMYFLPETWLLGLKDIAWAIGWLGMFCAGIGVLVAVLTHRKWSLAFFLPGLGLYFVLEFFGTLGYEWWGQYIWVISLINALLGVMVFGTAYVFWNIKETVQPFELTGFDRVLYKMMKPFLPDAIRRDLGVDKDELVELQAEYDALLEEFDARGDSPVIVHSNTYAGRLGKAGTEWQLAVAQFVFIGSNEEKGFSRSNWLDRTLPCGLKITDPLWRYLCSQNIGVLHTVGCDVLTKKGRATVLNDSHDADTLMGMAQGAEMPEGMKPTRQ